MGYIDAGIYQAYINKWIQCDIQAAFLRRPFTNALFKSLTYISQDINLQAFKAVADLINNSLKTYPLIVELCQWRNTLSKATRGLYRTLKNA